MKPGTEQEFIDFFTGSAQSLRRTAYMLTGDWHRADDVVQVAMLKMYVSWPRMRRSEALWAYARRAVVTSALDEGRRPWRRERSVESTGEEPVRRDRTQDVDNRLIVVAALASLPPGQRAAIVLRYYDDLSVEETARVLACTQGNVKSQTARGLDTLRVRLHEAGLSHSVTVGEDHP